MTTITDAQEHAKVMRRWLNGPANDQTEDELFRDLDETLGHLEVLLDMVTKCTCGSYDTKIIEIRKHCRDCERDMVRQTKEEMAKGGFKREMFQFHDGGKCSGCGEEIEGCLFVVAGGKYCTVCAEAMGGGCKVCNKPHSYCECTDDKDFQREPCSHRRDRGNMDVEHYVCDLTRDKPCPDDMHDTCPGRVEDE